MVFNKIDAYTPEVSDDHDTINQEKSKANYSIEDWEKTWMRKLEGNALFISALNKENLNDFRKMVYREVRKIHIQRFPYNHFLYPDIETIE